jgi:limonene-1,2-epoxide hydrolase
MRPAIGNDALTAYLSSTTEEIGAHLETITTYEDMLITQRVGRVVGEPAEQPQVILSLVRVQDGRITSWQDFFEPSPIAALADPPRDDSRIG